MKTKNRKLEKSTHPAVRLEYGKFYRMRKGAFLWKSDRIAPDRAQNNTTLGVLIPGTLVMATKKGRWRYVQVIHNEMIGYVWCPLNTSLADGFCPVDENNERDL